MNMRRLLLFPLFLFILTGVLTSCDQDLLGLDHRRVVGEYMLHRWEDGKTFYLEEQGKQQDGGGAIGGVVARIGWNDRYIIVMRNSTFGGDDDGWMIVDAQKHIIQGPFSDMAMREKPESKGVELLAPEEAWSKLK